MSDIIESLGRALLAIAKYIFIYGFIELFVHGCGYVILKAFSLGKYPASRQHNKNVCIGTGLIVLAVVIGGIALYNSR